MRWWGRLLACSIRGSFERATLRVVSLAVAAATVAIVLVVAVSVVPAVLFALQKKGLDQRWAASVGTPAEVFERVIPHGASSSALRLDRAAASFGIDLTPGDNLDRVPRTAPPLTKNPELGSWCDAVTAGSGDAEIPVPESVRAILEDRKDALTEIIACLTDDEPIVWDLESAMGGGGRVPSPSQLLKLHRWLAAAAAHSRHQGDDHLASACLEASWWLNQESLRRPERDMRLAGYSALELELAMVRAAPSSLTSETWLARLDELDPVGKLGGWVLIEAYSLPASTARGTLRDGGGPWPLVLSLAVDPARRWLLTSASESLRVGTESQAGAGFTTVDPDLRYVESHHRISRWNRVARAALPNPWCEWQNAARARLAAELTAEVLWFESATGEIDELVAQLPVRRPSGVADAFWAWTAEPDGLRVRLDHEAELSPASRRLLDPPLEHIFDSTLFPPEPTDAVGAAPDAVPTEEG